MKRLIKYIIRKSGFDIIKYPPLTEEQHGQLMDLSSSAIETVRMV